MQVKAAAVANVADVIIVVRIVCVVAETAIVRVAQKAVVAISTQEHAKLRLRTAVNLEIAFPARCRLIAAGVKTYANASLVQLQARMTEAARIQIGLAIITNVQQLQPLQQPLLQHLPQPQPLHSLQHPQQLQQYLAELKVNLVVAAIRVILA